MVKIRKKIIVTFFILILLCAFSYVYIVINICKDNSNNFKRNELLIMELEEQAINKQLEINDLKTKVNDLKNENEELKDELRKSPQWELIPYTSKSTFKSYMDKKAVTDTNSNQYKLLQQSKLVEGLYYYQDRVCVAMSSYFGSVGDVLRITLSSGQVFECVLADIKQDIHVNSNGEHHTDGSVIEFVVDVDTLNNESKVMGSLNNLYNGSIVKVEKVNRNGKI